MLNFEKIESLRKKKCLSKKGLAAKAGISPRALSYIFKEEMSPTLRMLTKLARALDVNIAVLIRKF